MKTAPLIFISPDFTSEASLLDQVFADEDVEAVELVAAQAGGVFGECAAAGADGVEGVGDTGEDVGFDVGVVVAGAEVVEFIEAVAEFLVGGDVVVEVDVWAEGVEGDGEEVVAGEEEAMFFIEDADLAGGVAGGVDDFQGPIAEVDDVAFADELGRHY